MSEADLREALKEYDRQIALAEAHSLTALINKRLPAAEACIARFRAALGSGSAGGEETENG